MIKISLHANFWRNKDDIFREILPQIGAPAWHGHNLDALEESLTGDDINSKLPPFSIEVSELAFLSQEVAQFYSQFRELIVLLRNNGIVVELIEN